MCVVMCCWESKISNDGSAKIDVVKRWTFKYFRQKAKCNWKYGGCTRPHKFGNSLVGSIACRKCFIPSFFLFTLRSWSTGIVRCTIIHFSPRTSFFTQWKFLGVSCFTLNVNNLVTRCIPAKIFWWFPFPSFMQSVWSGSILWYSKCVSIWSTWKKKHIGASCRGVKRRDRDSCKVKKTGPLAANTSLMFRVCVP
jgi:hypothetical protein